MNDNPNHNIARRLSGYALRVPHAIAIAEARKGGREYRSETFSQLEQSSTEIALGFRNWGVQTGMRLVLAVPFGIDFVRLVFALLKAGTVPVLVDPGMGRENLIRCLQDAAPDGFIASPRLQVVRKLMSRRFPTARWNVTVGPRRLWPGKTLDRIQRLGIQHGGELPTIHPGDPAAVIFTTGSTGPPKGVLYTHAIFAGQVDLIREHYQIQPGGRDIACFPLFALFDAVMGVTTIIPDMDPTRPADVDPEHIIQAVRHWEADQAFGSPALWKRVAGYCVENKITLPSLRRILSAGAPVPAEVLRQIRETIAADGNAYTPYGATEALPIASIESREVLGETAEKSAAGDGTCVGRHFDQIEWRVIEISDRPLETIADTTEVTVGEIGELIVTGPTVTAQYVTRIEQNALHKVRDGNRCWHRMGDCGYLDDQGRFWFCGRKSHRVQTTQGTLFTIPCETIINRHPEVQKSALVGVGSHGAQRPVVVLEVAGQLRTGPAAADLCERVAQFAARHEKTKSIHDFRVYPGRLPVDIRHNSKIFREQIVDWVAAHDATTG